MSTNIHSVDELAHRTATKLERIANRHERKRRNSFYDDVAFLKKHRRDLSDRAANMLCQSLTELVGRLERIRDEFKPQNTSRDLLVGPGQN